MIFIGRCFINYPQDQIIILRGVLDEVDDILSTLPGDEDIRILVLPSHGKLAYFRPHPIPYYFTLHISRFNGIDDTMIIILELESPILLQNIGFTLLIIFLHDGGLPISFNVDT